MHRVYDARRTNGTVYVKQPVRKRDVCLECGCTRGKTFAYPFSASGLALMP